MNTIVGDGTVVIEGNKYKISEFGNIELPNGSMATKRVIHNTQYMIINNRTIRVYMLLLEGYYGITEDNINDYIVVLDNPTTVMLSNINVLTIKEFCKKDQPRVRYCILKHGARSYIFFNNGKLFNISTGKYQKQLKNGPSGMRVNSYNILGTHIGIVKAKAKYFSSTQPDGLTYDLLNNDVTPTTNTVTALDKFRCVTCELVFRAISLERVIANNKTCDKCLRSLKLSPNKPVQVPTYNNPHKDNKTSYVCKRCLVTYTKQPASCVKCDCLEFYTN